MHSLIVDDEFTSRNILGRMLSPMGRCDIAANGEEAVDAFHAALEAADPYQLVCVDIEMPKLDGHQTLQALRQLERQYDIAFERRSVILMTTAHNESKQIFAAFREECDGYLVKPITTSKVREMLRQNQRANLAATLFAPSDL